MSIRFLHTADWHLGQLFHDYDRDYEHRQFLEWLRGVLLQERPDVLLLAGDVFDTVNPSAQAQRRFYNFLASARAVLPRLQFVITAGNHDAGARLESPSGLFEALQIHLVGTVPRDEAGNIVAERFLVPLKNAEGVVEAIAIAVPFLRPTDVPPTPEGGDSYLDGIRELYRSVTSAAERLRDERYPGAVLVALGHCHFAGADESTDSERRLTIGGAESLRADTFPPSITYVALGHLHKPQSFDGGRIHYCGSPIPLSFSERDYAHRVLMVTLDGGQLTCVAELQVPRFTQLLRIPAQSAAEIDEVVRQLADIPSSTAESPELHPFLEVYVIENGPDPRRRHRIDTALQGKAARLAIIKTVRPDSDAATVTVLVDATALSPELHSLDAETLLRAAHHERFGTTPSEPMLACLREILLADTTHAPETTPVFSPSA